MGILTGFKDFFKRVFCGGSKKQSLVKCSPHRWYFVILDNFFSNKSDRPAATAHFTALEVCKEKIAISNFFPHIGIRLCDNDDPYNSSYFGKPKYDTSLLICCELKHDSAQQRLIILTYSAFFLFRCL